MQVYTLLSSSSPLILRICQVVGCHETTKKGLLSGKQGCLKAPNATPYRHHKSSKDGLSTCQIKFMLSSALFEIRSSCESKLAWNPWSSFLSPSTVRVWACAPRPGSPLLLLINSVLPKHSHASLSRHCLYLFPCYGSGVQELQNRFPNPQAYRICFPALYWDNWPIYGLQLLCCQSWP